MSASIMWLPVALTALLATATADIMVFTQDLPHIIVEEFRDLPASFGPDLPLEGLRAYLVVGAPEDGCSALAKPPPDDDNFTGRWAVLLARFNCSFEMKVRNAQAAGFQAAIVHNVNSSDLETMSAKDPAGIVIPSVFVRDIAGLMLAEQYTYDKGFYIMVNGDLPFNINTHLLLPFAIVVALCLLVMIVFMVVKCIKDRRRARRHRLPSRALSKIPICKFSKGDPYDTCAVCLDDYQEGERLRVLPCAHAYHAKCIDPWLTENKRVCPVCKRRVFAAGERRRYHSDSDSDASSEPLRPAEDREQATQGGTFDEQNENPFVRATRFMQRLRRARRQEETQGEESVNQDNAENDAMGDETRPLLARVDVEAERPRPRRTRRSDRINTNTEPPPALSSSAHSINQEPPGVPTEPAEPGGETTAEPEPGAEPTAEPETGEIGVAALPASTIRDLSATHIRL